MRDETKTTERPWTVPHTPNEHATRSELDEFMQRRRCRKALNDLAPEMAEAILESALEAECVP
jgi:hypothetical protein